MSVIINDHQLKNLIHNGNAINVWFHNGIKVWQRTLDILREYAVNGWATSGYCAGFSVSTTQLSMTGHNPNGATSETNHTATAIMRSFFDISPFNTISVMGAVTIYAGGWSPQYAYIEILNASGGIAKTVYSQTLQCTPGTGYTWNINQNIDVSALKGNHRIRIRLLPYANWHVIINITKMMLSV